MIRDDEEVRARWVLVRLRTIPDDWAAELQKDHLEARARIAALEAEVARLKNLIEEAPHADECHTQELCPEDAPGFCPLVRPGSTDLCPGCDCWKLRAEKGGAE